MSEVTGQVEAEVNAVIKAPTPSRWLKVALKNPLGRDCVDAAHDDGRLAELSRRCYSVLVRV
jgi:hypothetical protein